MGKLSEALKAKLRCGYSEIVADVIDEISMVSNIRLLQIHKRVCEIFGCPEAIPFAGKSVILVGDLFQLPPVRASFVFPQYDSVFGSIFQLWDLFKILNLFKIRLGDLSDRY